MHLSELIQIKLLICRSIFHWVHHHHGGFLMDFCALFMQKMRRRKFRQNCRKNHLPLCSQLPSSSPRRSWSYYKVFLRSSDILQNPDLCLFFKCSSLSEERINFIIKIRVKLLEYIHFNCYHVWGFTHTNNLLEKPIIRIDKMLKRSNLPEYKH